ncbi:MAG: GNAT family N-acetyltransferase [Sandaracinaceae bacterium]|nr:GNAT family N-acetyltransferase [Sandaracinaceae bacterium]
MADIATRTERIEGHAWEDLYRGAAPHGVSVVTTSHAQVLLAPRLDHLLLNRAIGLASTEDVDGAVESFAELGVSRYLVHAAPGRGALRAALAARGLARYPRSWVKLARGRGALPPARTDLEVREAAPGDASFGAILAAGFDMPAGAAPLFDAALGRARWITLVACEDGVPVAAALAYAEGRTGYLAGGATLPSHRRRGAQGALVRERVARLLDLGCDLVVSETGESVPGDPQHSHRNLERFGLAPVYVRDNYVPAGTTWRADARPAWHHPRHDDAEAAPLRRTRARARGAP